MSTPSTATRETERTFETADGSPLADPGTLLGLGPGSAPRDQHLEAVYFDTPELGLLRAGMTLRRREGGHDEGWHLKLPVSGDTREELRLPLTRARRTPPREFVELTRLAARGAKLAPVAQLRTHRRRWVLLDEADRELVELVEDEVHAHTLGDRTQALSWREVEVELGAHGDPALLDRIERRLRKAGAHRAASSSKLRRVLGDRLPASAATPGRRRRRGSAGAALLRYLDAQVDQLRALDPQVRRDAPDALHQMRVTCRRLRSVLRAYPRLIDRAATDGLVAELRWLAGELGPARDTEVLAARLDSVLHELPEQLVVGPVSAHLTRTLQRRLAEGRESAHAALAQPRYLALHRALDQLVADPPLTRRASRPARAELTRGVATAWRRTAARMADVDTATPGARRDEALHETRKAAKRLRYALEVATPETGKQARRLATRLKRFQDVLGEHQDAAVARPVLHQLGLTAHQEGGNGFSYGVLHGEERLRAALAELHLPRTWARLTGPRATAWLER